jgi:transposase
MSEAITFVGMDVHQHSIDLTLAEGGHDGAITHFASIGGDLAALDGAVATLRRRGTALHFVYEAGPCGYGIYRHLRAAGLACAVVAPAQVPKRAADRIKTDRRDSRTLALQHRAGALRPIYVPDEDDEAMRDLVRAREDAVHTRRRARQRINSFLLRHGRSSPHGRKNWGARHRRWLAEQSFERVAQRITLEEYLGAADEGEARVGRLTEQIRSRLAAWRWREVVEALQALRGVSRIVAVTVVAEVGDLTRFQPRQLMAFLGLVPAEYSSGARRRQGAITKTGNAHVRRVLAEAAHAYRATPALTQFIRQRQIHLPQPIRDIGWKAQLRLCHRFRHLSAARKHPHKIRVALARELTGFMLDIARRVTAPGSGPTAPPHPHDVVVLRPRRRPTAAPGSGRARAAHPAPRTR